MRCALTALLAIATTLATVAALRECASCAGPRLGLAGAVFYATMLAGTAIFGPARPIALALLAAFGFHAGLLASGSACALCWASAACSLAIAIVVGRFHRTGLAIAPWTAALAFSLAPAPPPPSPAHVTVYTQDGCPHCDDLRERVMPEATRGLAVDVRYIPAGDRVRATPTIVVGRRLIEGVPPADLLRETILMELKP